MKNLAKILAALSLLLVLTSTTAHAIGGTTWNDDVSSGNTQTTSIGWEAFKVWLSTHTW